MIPNKRYNSLLNVANIQLDKVRMTKFVNDVKKLIGHL